VLLVDGDWCRLVLVGGGRGEGFVSCSSSSENFFSSPIIQLVSSQGVRDEQNENREGGICGSVNPWQAEPAISKSLTRMCVRQEKCFYYMIFMNINSCSVWFQIFYIEMEVQKLAGTGAGITRRAGELICINDLANRVSTAQQDKRTSVHGVNTYTITYVIENRKCRVWDISHTKIGVTT
jgi:hypothetical protein